MDHRRGWERKLDAVLRPPLYCPIVRQTKHELLNTDSDPNNTRGFQKTGTRTSRNQPGRQSVKTAVITRRGSADDEEGARRKWRKDGGKNKDLHIKCCRVSVYQKNSSLPKRVGQIRRRPWVARHSPMHGWASSAVARPHGLS